MNKILTLVMVLAGCGGTASTKATEPTPEPMPVADPTPPPTTGAPAEPLVPPEPAGPDPAKVKADLVAAETAAYDKAKPVFEKYCASCHRQGQKQAKKKSLEHFDITTYPFGGHHAMELGKTVRDVLAINGGKPTMPKGKPGAVKGDELALIATWADAFDASHAGGAHEGHAGHGGHDHDGGHDHEAPKTNAAPTPHGADHKH